MAENGNDLSTKQVRAVQALLSAKNVAEAAERSGVGGRTLHRWLTEDDAFRAALAAAEAELLDAATRRLLCLQGVAIDTFEAVLSNEEASLALKLRAAGQVLDISLKLREVHNFEARMAELERAVALTLAQAQQFANAAIERGEARRVDYRVALRETDPRHESD